MPEKRTRRAGRRGGAPAGVQSPRLVRKGRDENFVPVGRYRLVSAGRLARSRWSRSRIEEGNWPRQPQDAWESLEPRPPWPSDRADLDYIRGPFVGKASAVRSTPSPVFPCPAGYPTHVVALSVRLFDAEPRAGARNLMLEFRRTGSGSSTPPETEREDIRRHFGDQRFKACCRIPATFFARNRNGFLGCLALGLYSDSYSRSPGVVDARYWRGEPLDRRSDPLAKLRPHGPPMALGRCRLPAEHRLCRKLRELCDVFLPTVGGQPQGKPFVRTVAEYPGFTMPSLSGFCGFCWTDRISIVLLVGPTTF